MKLYDIFSGEELKIAEKIQQRRLQILVHSYLYYQVDTNIVDDNTWATWGKELVSLQEQYPEIAKRVIYHKEFANFDPSTGQGLPYNDKRIVHIAKKIRQHQNLLNFFFIPNFQHRKCAEAQ